MTQPTFAEGVFAQDAELAEYRERQTREYGTYVATARIYAGNALAYDIGHPVPVSNVIRHGYWLNGQVGLVDGAQHPAEILALIEPPRAPDVTRDDVTNVPDEDGDR